MDWLRCLCARAEKYQPEQPNPRLQSHQQLILPPGTCSQPAVALNEATKEQHCESSTSTLAKGVESAYAGLTCAGGSSNLYCRINVLLDTCRIALGASDARLAFLSTDSSTWVFLSSSVDGPESVPRAVGWGKTPLYRLLAEQSNSIVIIRGYHSVSAAASDGPTSVTTTNAGVPNHTRTSPPSPTGQSPSQRLQHQQSGCADASTKPLRTGPPDPFAFVCRSASKAANLQSSDLLVLPVRHEGRLAAALLLGWESPPVSSSSPQTPTPQPSVATRHGRSGAGSNNSGGMVITPWELAQLQRLAQFLAFGVICDPQQERMLEQVTRRFASLPAANGVHDFVTCLLEAVPELLNIRFALRPKPILLLSLGASSGPAVFFARRQQQPHDIASAAATAAEAGAAAGEALPSQPRHQQQHSAANGCMAAGSSGFLPPNAPVNGGLARAASGNNIGGGGGSGGGGLVRAGSNVSVHFEGPAETETEAGAGTGGMGESRVRAVRISLHHTLLGDTLRSATKLQHQQQQQRRETAATYAASFPTSADDGDQSLAPSLTANQPPPPPSPPRLPAITPHLYSTFIPNLATHLLEEGAPCRDLLLCSNLTGCGSGGAIVLCVELPQPPPAAAAGASGEGTAAGAGAPAHLQVQPMHQSRMQLQQQQQQQSQQQQPLGRQFGMYLVFADPLPPSVLQAVGAELKLLLGMALGACRDAGGALAYSLPANTRTGGSGGGGGGGGAGCGRLALELFSLQEQMLGASPAAAAAAAFAAANASNGGVSSGACVAGGVSGGESISISGVFAAAVGSGSAAPAVLPSLLGRRAGARFFALKGRPLPRLVALASASVSGAPPGGSPKSGLSGLGSRRFGGISSAGTPRPLGPTRALSSLLHYHHKHRGRLGFAQGGDAMDEALEGAVSLGVTGGGAALTADEAGSLAWMMASSPEVLLEAPAAGPSPLEVMVSSMRTGLTAALSNAMLLESNDEARAAMCQELAAIRLFEVIGRGGQGVVFHGTLHGLETAVKVIVHRGKGEPLAHDAGDPGVGGGCDLGGEEEGGGGGDGEEGAEGAEDFARIRKAKRGAMELVVTGTLSHPNIVQVLASFSDVVMVRVTYKNEPTPRLKLVAKDDPVLAGWATPGPLNTVVCLEYCDCGTLLAAAHAGAFRPPGGSLLAGAVRPALVPLYTSLLEVALALRYMHSRRLVHCDLKPSNVLLKSSTRDPRGWTCKLSDFGCVRLMTELPVPATTSATASGTNGFSTRAASACQLPASGSAAAAAVAAAPGWAEQNGMSTPHNNNNNNSSSGVNGPGSIGGGGVGGGGGPARPLPQHRQVQQLQQQWGGGNRQQPQWMSGGGGGGPQQQQQKDHYQQQQQAPQAQQPQAPVIGFTVAQPLGTIAYMAPESFIRGHTLSAAVDIYAFGILMYELLMCRTAYSGMDIQKLPRMVIRQHLRPEFHPLSPPEYCHLAARCWSAQASRRPTAAQLVAEVETRLAEAQETETRRAAAVVAAATATAAATVLPMPPSPPPLAQQQLQAAGSTPRQQPQQHKSTQDLLPKEQSMQPQPQQQQLQPVQAPLRDGSGGAGDWSACMLRPLSPQQLPSPQHRPQPLSPLSHESKPPPPPPQQQHQQQQHQLPQPQQQRQRPEPKQESQQQQQPTLGLLPVPLPPVAAGDQSALASHAPDLCDSSNVSSAAAAAAAAAATTATAAAAAALVPETPTMDAGGLVDATIEVLHVQLHLQQQQEREQAEQPERPEDF